MNRYILFLESGGESMSRKKWYGILLILEWNDYLLGNLENYEATFKC